MAESNYKALNMNVEAAEYEAGEGIANYPEIFNSYWYKDIVYLLNFNCPPEMEKSKRRAMKYFILEDNLYWKDPVGVLLRCVDEAESQEIMTEIHARVCGGHLYWRANSFL